MDLAGRSCLNLQQIFNCYIKYYPSFKIVKAFFKVLDEIMTMSEVADLRKHNDHLIMSFVIQAIVNIRKANHLIIFFIDVNPMQVHADWLL